LAAPRRQAMVQAPGAGERRCCEGTGEDGEAEGAEPDEVMEDGLYYVLMMDMAPHRPIGDFSRAQLEPKLQELGVPWNPTSPFYIFGIPGDQCERCRRWLQELGYNITAPQRVLPDYDGHARDRSRSPRAATL